MVDIQNIIYEGLILSACAALFITITMRVNPRIWLHDYPKDIQAMVPPKSEKEKRLSQLLGIPFLVLLFAFPFYSTLTLRNTTPGEISFGILAINAFGVVFVFNLVDWLILDWLMFCTITPSFVVIPGSERAKGYKDYGFHFRGFLIGTFYSVLVGVIIGLTLSI